MKTPIIEIRDLWFYFDEYPVLTDVNLKINRGDFMAILGPNGAGKSTLIKLMLGLLKPNRGIIRVFGKPPRKVVNRIGYMPQGVNINKGFPISVMDVVLMGRLRPGMGWYRYTKEDRISTQKALEQMDMWGYRNYHIEELSGGQRQRVLIARALVSKPEVLFLDEPTASVDTKGQTELYDLLKILNETVTIVIVSHDLSVVSSYVKSVACLNQQLFFHDAPEITRDMLEMLYHCPVELVAHGMPHRVLPHHEDK